MSLRSKLDRAIVAYLKSRGVCENVYPANYSQERAFPNVTVWSHAGSPSPQFTGTYRFRVDVRVQFQAPNQPEEVNPEASRVSVDTITDAVLEALLVTDTAQDLQATASLITNAGNALAVAIDDTEEATLRASNNADMAAFTCQQWLEAGLDGGAPSDDGAAWAEILSFTADAANSADLL